MPFVINGVGTWNYGKERVHRIKMACEFCKGVGEMTSYDTTTYFVVVFVPILPLKKLRVLNECPYCQKYRAASLKEWNRARDEAVNAALEKLAANPNDNEMLGEALATATHFQDEPLFDRIAALAKDSTEDPKLQFLLGETCGYFSRREEADVAFRHALRNDPSPEVHQSAAMNALRMGDFDGATQLLEYVTRDKVEQDVPYLLAVQDSLQSKGRHAEALALMDKRDAAFPELATDKVLAKARKQSEKYLNSGKRLNTMNLVDSSRSGSDDGSPGRSKFAKLIFPILLIAGLIGYVAYSLWLGENQPVYLVNGSGRVYMATVNGKSHTLQPGTPLKVRVPEGTVTVEADGFDPAEAVVKHDFWSRPFDGKLVILNPDRVALIEEASATYSKTPGGVNPQPYVHVGHGSYSFASPDYAFEPFPAQISVKGNHTVTKTRVGLSPMPTPVEYLAILFNSSSGVEPAAAAKALCQAFPDEPLYLNAASRMLPVAVLEAALKPALARRPLAVDAHRAFQTAVDTKQPERDLVPEYAKLNEELKTADSLYLLARVQPEIDTAAAMMTKAAAMSPPSLSARYSLANRALAMAKPAEAVKQAAMAYEAQPGNMIYQRMYLDALWANGDDTRAKDVLTATAGGNPFFYADLLRVGARMKDPDLENLARTMRTDPAKPHESKYAYDRQAAEAVRDGDGLGYVTALQSLGQSRNVIGPLISENPAAAEADLGDSATVSNIGLVMLGYAKKNQPAKAAALRPKFLSALKGEGRQERRLAAMMEGTTPFDLDAATKAVIRAEEKRVVLLVLAGQFPQHAPTLKTMAAKLNEQVLDAAWLVLK